MLEGLSGLAAARMEWDQVGCEEAYLGNKLAAAARFSNSQIVAQ
jgi:hypothetical protein